MIRKFINPNYRLTTKQKIKNLEGEVEDLLTTVSILKFQKKDPRKYFNKYKELKDKARYFKRNDLLQKLEIGYTSIIELIL